MQLIIVGSGKLSNSINEYINKEKYGQIIKWSKFNKAKNENVIIIHAGSGREMNECIDYCSENNASLIELSTGTNIDKYKNNFPVFICANTSLLLIKMMYLLKQNGRLFKNNKIEIIESHQEQKKSLPGTAVSFANSLGVDNKNIKSIRNRNDQISIGIEERHLNLHAYHKIQITDNYDSELIFETKVNGHRSYVDGLEKIIDYISVNKLENRKYFIEELIANI